MLINVIDLFYLFNLIEFFLLGWVYIVLYCMNAFVNCISRKKVWLSFLFTVFCLIYFDTIAIYLGYNILNIDIIVMIITEVLFHFVNTVIELAYIDLSILYYPDVDNDINYFEVCKFYYD